MDNTNSPLDEAVDYIRIALKDPRQQVCELMFLSLPEKDKALIAINVQEAIEKGQLDYNGIVSFLEYLFSNHHPQEYQERTRKAWTVIKEASTSYQAELTKGWEEQLRLLENMEARCDG